MGFSCSKFKMFTRSACVPLIVVSFSVASAQMGAPKPMNAPAEPPAMAPKETAAEVKGSIVMPRVFFITPKAGDTISGEFTVKFGVEGMKIAPAGQIVPGTGHHHLIVDGGAIAKGEVIPTDDKHIHFGKGQTETKLKLAPGVHTLTLQFADGAHRSYGEPMSTTIQINVR